MRESVTSEILTRVKISEVYRALTGVEPRQTGSGKYRGRAVWRDGNGLNVSMDDGRAVWFDFACGEGGGILDLVARIRGGSRQDALKWLGEYSGAPLTDRPLSAAQKAEWARRKCELDWHLPTARYWQRAAIVMTEDLLATLKDGLQNPAVGVELFEIFNAERLLKRLKRIDGFELLEEFRWWEQHNPDLAAGLIHAAKLRETAELRGLKAYVDSLVMDGWTGVTN